MNSAKSFGGCLSVLFVIAIVIEVIRLLMEYAHLNIIIAIPAALIGIFCLVGLFCSFGKDGLGRDVIGLITLAGVGGLGYLLINTGMNIILSVVLALTGGLAIGAVFEKIFIMLGLVKKDS